MDLFTSLALIAGIIGTLAYAPQIHHIIKTKNAKGISVKAWLLWLLTGLIILVYSVHKGDIVFITLTTLNSISIITVLILAFKYNKKHRI